MAGALALPHALALALALALLGAGAGAGATNSSSDPSDHSEDDHDHDEGDLSAALALYIALIGLAGIGLVLGAPMFYAGWAWDEAVGAGAGEPLVVHHAHSYPPGKGEQQPDPPSAPTAPQPATAAPSDTPRLYPSPNFGSKSLEQSKGEEAWRDDGAHLPLMAFRV